VSTLLHYNTKITEVHHPLLYDGPNKSKKEENLLAKLVGLFGVGVFLWVYPCLGKPKSPAGKPPTNKHPRGNRQHLSSDKYASWELYGQMALLRPLGNSAHRPKKKPHFPPQGPLLKWAYRGFL